MNEPNPNASEALTNSNQDFGKLLGESKSTSEKLQLAICLLTLLAFGLLWLEGVVSSLVMIIGCVVSCYVVHRITLSLEFLRSSLRVHENGIHLNLRGKKISFPYEAVTSIASKHTHHYMNHRYVATKAEFEFEIENLFRPVRYECDYRRGSSSEPVVNLVTELCGEAVQKRLFAKLKREGEVAWTSGLYRDLCLTAEGLRMSEPESQPRVIRYEDIDGWKLEDKELKVFKTGDAMPFLVIGKDTPNFIPMFGLLENICQCARNQHSPRAEAEPSEAAQYLQATH